MERAGRILKQLAPDALVGHFKQSQVKTGLGETVQNGSLEGKTVFITGGSRGIGLSIARRCAQAGANVIIAAKTVKAHPKYVRLWRGGSAPLGVWQASLCAHARVLLCMRVCVCVYACMHL